MSSNGPSEHEGLKLEAHLPTSEQDIDVLGRLRRETPSWLSLSPEQIETLLPEGALDRRPPTPPGARPFTLP